MQASTLPTVPESWGLLCTMDSLEKGQIQWPCLDPRRLGLYPQKAYILKTIALNKKIL